MSVAFLILGTALVLIALVDALWTTLWVDGGAGPVSSRLTTWLWRGALAVLGRDRHLRLSLFGPFILFLTLITWIVLLWAGWVLLFAADPQSLMHTSQHVPADWSGRIYFVGYMMFTAGNGDYAPQGDGWQLAAVLTNGAGMVAVTLAITYLLSVISAVVRKRAFAAQVTGLGMTAEAFVRNSWDGQDFRSLELPLSGIASELAMLSQQYEAYPVLQYYHGAEPSKSPIVALAVLDEALTLLRFGVEARVRPSAAVLASARATVGSFLETMPSAFIHPAPDPPPPPDLAAVRQHGAPTVGEAEFAAALEGLSERRKKLLGLLRNDGWNWSDRTA